ncbi:MAG: hypothetical protein HRT81_07525 [Henriciella sp.]|nr:hypothetical protein [Henriciella sp.]
MAVELEIRDGDPWWLSPDIWVVPGSDPLGAPGIPVAGSSAFVWARVRNNGDTAVTNAEVRYYWADPSAGFDRNTANLIGSAFVSLNAGEVSEVLLLAPWVPEFVNNGHECVFAEAFHPFLDPLPSSPAFNVPTDRHVAQRNLTVVQAAANGFFAAKITQFNTSRLQTKFKLTAELADLKLLAPLAKSLNLRLDPKAKPGTVERLQYSDKPCPAATDLKKKKAASIEFALDGNRKTQRSLVGVHSGGPSLIHVKLLHLDRLIGGQSILVLPTDAKTDTRKTSARKATAQGVAA